MSTLLLLDSQFYTWGVLPFLIFTARILDVSFGTVRVIFVSRGLKYLAALVGFFEVLIWVLTIGQIMKHLSNPLCYIAYAGGFAMGNFVGIGIAERLSLGIVLVRVVTQNDAQPLVDTLRSRDYGVTSVEGQGKSGRVKVVFTVVRRREVRPVVDLIRQFNPDSFYSIEEVGFVERGVFPLRKGWNDFGLARIFRGFRQGK